MTPDILLKCLSLGIKELTDVRQDNHIHVSNLIRFCPREYALLQLKGVDYNNGKIIPLGQAVTFQIGHAVHRIVTKALKQVKILEERECVVGTKEYGIPIVGSCDNLIRAPFTDGPFFATEVKSIKEDDFNSLTEPLAEHECQLSLYLWLIEKEPQYGNVRTDKGFVIYVCKTQKSQPLKVFEIQRNDTFIDGVVKKLNALKTFSEEGKVPEALCENKHRMMAKRCSARNECFSA